MNTCPHCGMPTRTNYTLYYLCGSRAAAHTNRSTACYQNEITMLRDRVAKLTSAGQHAVDYCDGKHAMLNEVLEGWRKATE